MLEMLESQVLTKVKYGFSGKLKEKYPKINFTTSDMNNDNSVFPTVYIHEMPGAESGNDTESNKINAVLSSFQIEVTSNVSQNDAATVMNEVVRIMKEMRFSLIGWPEFQNTSVYRKVARFRRMIADDDKI